MPSSDYLAALQRKLLSSPKKRLVAEAEHLTCMLILDGSLLTLQWGETHVDPLWHVFNGFPQRSEYHLPELVRNAEKSGLSINEKMHPLEIWHEKVIMGRIVAATRPSWMSDTITGCDVEGSTHSISVNATQERFVHELWSNRIHMKNAKHGRDYDAAVVNADLFSRLCQSLKQQNTKRFYVSEIRVGEVALREAEHTFTVERREDQWYCANRKCLSQDHSACSHVRYVHALIPVEAVRLPSSRDG